MDATVAVIDVGSNSGRVVVVRVAPTGHLEILADGRAPFRLARDLAEGGRIGEETLGRTVGTLRDFRAVAETLGAERLVAVATAAVREAANGDELVRRARREAGLWIRVIDGAEEARLSFLGAVHGLDVESGVVLDIGGGSLEVTRFVGRRPIRAWTFPLGALRTSDHFLVTDPPRAEDAERLRWHAVRMFAEAGVLPMRSGERLVGTGGTIRNLAKVDRRARGYPIPRLHGYVLSISAAAAVAEALTTRPLARRRAIPGLNPDRADSVVGGAVVALALMETIGATELTVSGQGLREGIVLDAVPSAPQPVAAVREASVASLAARFATFDPGRAERRAGLAERLHRAIEPEDGPREVERTRLAATLLDVGAAIDHYRRHDHAADIVVQSDLVGLSHRELALLAGTIRRAGDPDARWQEFRPLLGPEDGPRLARAGTLLALADEIERLAPGDAIDAVRAEARRKRVTVTAPIHDPWRRESLGGRFARAFGRRLEIAPGAPER